MARTSGAVRAILWKLASSREEFAVAWPAFPGARSMRPTHAALLAIVITLSACGLPERPVTDREPLTPLLAPVASTCAFVPVDADCTTTIALLNASGTYVGLEFRVASPKFALVGARSVANSTGGDCLSNAGPSKVIVVCSEPFAGSGDVAVITLHRTEPGSASVTVYDAYLAPDGDRTLDPVPGGAMSIAD